MPLLMQGGITMTHMQLEGGLEHLASFKAG